MPRLRSSAPTKGPELGVQSGSDRVPEVKQVLGTSSGTTTQSTELTSSLDGSVSDYESDDNRTIRSYAPPKTPTNSLISLDIEHRKAPADTSPARSKNIPGRDEQDSDLPAQLTSVKEVEEDDCLSLEPAVHGSGGSGNRADRVKDLRENQQDSRRTTQDSSTVGHNAIPSSTRDHSNGSGEFPSSYLSRAFGKGRSHHRAVKLDSGDAVLDQVNELTSSGGIRPLDVVGSTTIGVSALGGPPLLSPEYDDKEEKNYLSAGPETAPQPMEMESQDDQRERDKRRLEQLGYSEVLGRDYGFWSSFSVGYCVIGGFQGAVFNTYLTYVVGGPKYVCTRLCKDDGDGSNFCTYSLRMILIMWPLMCTGMLLLTCAMAELASAYPVAGAMATWTWAMARRGVGGERYWGWLIGGMVFGYHICRVGLVMVAYG